VRRGCGSLLGCDDRRRLGSDGRVALALLGLLTLLQLALAELLQPLGDRLADFADDQPQLRMASSLPGIHDLMSSGSQFVSTMATIGMFSCWPR